MKRLLWGIAFALTALPVWAALKVGDKAPRFFGSGFPGRKGV